ncbi:MAG: hypothetical protein U0136_14310 [Bdellovibrionota bacterium]
MARNIIFGLCGLVMLGCAAKPAPLSEAASHRAIIFVPGYKGSQLVDEEESVQWVNARQVFFGSTPLAVKQRGFGPKDPKELKPNGVLKAISVLPILYSYPIYRPWLSALHERFDRVARVIELDYDWRKSNLELVQKLDALIDDLRAHGVTDISVIGHSMGAKSLAYYLRYGAQAPHDAVENWMGAKKIDRAVLAAAPFKGAITILRDFIYGNKVFFNHNLLSAEAVSSFPSAYQLLPPAELDALVTPDGKSVAAKIFDVESWKQGAWGPFAPQMDDTQRAAAEEFVRAQLLESADFSRALNRPPGAKPEALRPAALLSVHGKGLWTLKKCLLAENLRPNVRCPDSGATEELPTGTKEEDYYENGDGVVTTRSLRLPEAYRTSLFARELETEGEHLDVLNIPEIQRAIFQYLEGTR